MKYLFGLRQILIADERNIGIRFDSQKPGGGNLVDNSRVQEQVLPGQKKVNNVVLKIIIIAIIFIIIEIRKRIHTQISIPIHLEYSKNRNNHLR